MNIDPLSASAHSVAELYRELQTSPQGLNQKRAEGLLTSYGANQLQSRNVSWWHILLRQFASPFIYLLLAAAALSFVLGEKIDGVMVLLFIGINVALGFFQEFRSEKTAHLLNAYLIPLSTVIRDGKEQSIPTPQLVPGDVLVLHPGDIVPADVRLTHVESVELDESALTGESAPVHKQDSALTAPATTVYAAKNICFSGTTVVSGKAVGVVIATGEHTKLGKVAALSSSSSRVSSFEKQMNSFSRFTLVLVGCTLVCIIIAHLLTKESADVSTLLIFSIALAVSVIPEALPAVITFSLSMGAHNLAKKKVIVKRLSAIEDLGAIEVLCCDKTGTLTQNKLTVSETWGEQSGRTTWLAALTLTDALANQSVNPFQSALHAALTPRELQSLKQATTLREFPFDPLRRRTSKCIQIRGIATVVSTGTVEDLVRSCPSLSDTKRREILTWATKQGELGKRVLAVASKRVAAHSNAPQRELEQHMQFEGMVSFIDPIKTSTFTAIEQAQHMGVQVKILTGDSREVAGAVAAKIGLIADPTAVITGSEFQKLSAVEQRKAVRQFHVFARVLPEQKLQIVQLLEANHEVGFLGEGINDAPALKVANVALVVDGASDVARESADIILLKKSLKVIVDGIREGRSVFANTSKYITATLSANFGNFFAVALASLVIDYLPMLPLQILLLNLLSDFPMVAIATDTVDRSELTQPSRYDLKHFALTALLLGMVSTTFDFAFFGMFVKQQPSTLQTAWFMGSILTELVFIYSVRSTRFFAKAVFPSKQLLVLTFLAVLATVLLPFTSWGQAVFGFTQLSVPSLGMVFGLTAAYFVATETVKLAYLRFNKPAQP